MFGVVLQILYAPRGVARIDEVLSVGFCRPVVVHAVLRERSLEFVPVARVVLQQYLIVVVFAFGVAVYAVCNGQVAFAIRRAEARAERYAVETA